jgi:alpha-beta hydrolase superfamily lysophospholipase
MTATTFSWRTSDGLNIQGHHWKVDAPIAAVGFVHGMGEHGARYAHVAAAFAEAGIASMAYDRRGHGQSDGERGHTISFEAFIEEIKSLVTQLKRIYPGIPVFLYGHSMGGNLVLNYLIDEKVEVDGVIASAPWIELAFKPSPFKIQMGKLVRSLAPAMKMKNDLNPKHISRDPEMVQAYISDPLVHDKITPNTGVFMLDRASTLQSYAGDIEVPLLIMHGTGDQIISYKAAHAFAERVTGPISFKTWEGGYHEIHNDTNREEVIEYAKEWLLEQIALKNA